MNGSKEIVTISIPKGDLNNDYTFFEDGKICRNYNQHANKVDLEAWISPRNMADSDKEKILMACPLSFKAKIAAKLRK